MCCLKYEQAAYEDLLKTTPKTGTHVQTPEGRGVITEVSLLRGNLKVALDKHSNGAVTVFHKDQVRPIRAERREDGGHSAPPASEPLEHTSEPHESKPEHKDEPRRPRPRRRSNGPKKPPAPQA